MNSQLRGACIFGQSGGPTSVINASAYGVIKTALECPEITAVYGAAHGITGVLDDKLYDMSKEDPEELALLMQTPSSELGSCRYKLADPDDDDTDCKRILEIFKKYDVRYFFYNGGNDSMDTCSKISRYMEKVGYECRVIGVPKTIDNDLYITDHCPGFGSAARFIATTCADISKDACVYGKGAITIIEAMGRHAGWLAGSAAVAKLSGCPIDFIFLPEVTFDLDNFIEKVTKRYAEKGDVIVVVSEGIRYADGNFVSAAQVSTSDGFSHAQLGGLAAVLANEMKKRTNAKIRGVELNLMQRCFVQLASQTDLDEAFTAGSTAVKCAVAGETGKMVALVRASENGKYKCEYALVPLADVANAERPVPREWINEEGDNVTEEFIDYVLPLISGQPDIKYENSLPRYANLKKVLVK